MAFPWRHPLKIGAFILYVQYMHVYTSTYMYKNIDSKKFGNTLKKGFKKNWKIPSKEIVKNWAIPSKADMKILCENF